MSTSGPEKTAACPEFDRLLVLYAWDELEPTGRATVEEHIARCAACTAVLSAERRILELAATVEPEAPSELLLANCRHALAETLDGTGTETGPLGRLRRMLAPLRPARWVALRPGWSIVLLLLLGIFVGRNVPSRPAPANEPPAEGQSYDSSAAPAPEVTGIHRVGENGVEVRMTAEQPMVVEGLAADQDVRQALVRVLRSGQGLDPDARLDSVELLQPMLTDADVRDALCHAARSDSNVSVRLKAVEALRGLERDALVRQAVLDALEHDPNPGVRVEAVNSLRAFLESAAGQAPPADERVLRVLHDRKNRDTNEFVRLQSAAAIQQIAERKAY